MLILRSAIFGISLCRVFSSADCYPGIAFEATCFNDSVTVIITIISFTPPLHKVLI